MTHMTFTLTTVFWVALADIALVSLGSLLWSARARELRGVSWLHGAAWLMAAVAYGLAVLVCQQTVLAWSGLFPRPSWAPAAGRVGVGLAIVGGLTAVVARRTGHVRLAISAGGTLLVWFLILRYLVPR
jgi:hypothetical protein